MLVGDGQAAGSGGVAIGNGDLLHGVDDLLTVCILVQIVEGAGPGGAGDDHGLAGVLAVCQQAEGDLVGTDAVLVVVVVPDLLDGNGGLLDFVLVGDGQAVDGGGVALGNLGLLHGVDDGLAVLVDLEALEGVGPVGSGQLCGGDHSAVGQQVDGDGAGTDAVLVVLVIPLLGDGDVLAVDLVGVGQSDLGVLEGDGGGVILVLGQLLDGVHMDLALGLDDQVIGLAVPGVAPAVLGIQDNGLTDGALALHQLDGDLGGTDAVLVALVVPDLGDGDILAGQLGLDAGNREGILLAVDVQVGLVVGGVVIALNEALELGIEGHAVGVSINIVGGVAFSLGGNVAQLPGVVVAVLVEAVAGTAGDTDVGCHGVGDSPALAAQTVSDGLGDGAEGSVQLIGVVGVVGTAGGGDAVTQEVADGGAAAVGDIIGNAEADGVQIGTGVFDGIGTVFGSGVVLEAALSAVAAVHAEGGDAVGQGDDTSGAVIRNLA